MRSSIYNLPALEASGAGRAVEEVHHVKTLVADHVAFRTSKTAELIRKHDSPRARELDVPVGSMSGHVQHSVTDRTLHVRRYFNNLLAVLF